MAYISEAEIKNYIRENKKYFNRSDLEKIETSISVSDITIEELDAVQFKSPNVGLALSIFLGIFGVDRFYSGNYVAGVIKLLSTGWAGVWWIIDWFLIKKTVRKVNYERLENYLNEDIRREIEKELH